MMLVSASFIKTVKMLKEFFFVWNSSAKTGLMWLLKMPAITVCG